MVSGWWFCIASVVRERTFCCCCRRCYCRCICKCVCARLSWWTVIIVIHIHPSIWRIGGLSQLCVLSNNINNHQVFTGVKSVALCGDAHKIWYNTDLNCSLRHAFLSLLLVYNIFSRFFFVFGMCIESTFLFSFYHKIINIIIALKAFNNIILFTL